MSVAVAPPRRKSAPDHEPFWNYREILRLLAKAMWHGIRIVSVGVFLALCVLLWTRPAGSLFVFWHCIVPVLPLLFFVAPGLWRNICPLAAANQVPRVLGFTRAGSLPGWLKERGYLVAMTAFLVIIPTRKVLFDANGPALSFLLLVGFAIAFASGVKFKGKSGFCSSMCPLLPVQRLYGQTPFVKVPDSHCEPCVGCAKNCYDLNPAIAYQADIADTDSNWVQPRKLFAAALPGVTVGFFAMGSQGGVAYVYGTFAIAVIVAIGIFFVVDSYTSVPSAWLTALWGSAAINLFYWYQARPMAAAVRQVTGLHASAMVWPFHAAVLLATGVWLQRTITVNRLFVDRHYSTRHRVPVPVAVPRHGLSSASATPPAGI